MRLLLLPIVAATVFMAAPLPAFAQSQAELNEQSGKRLEKADAELNKLYKQALQQHGDEPEFTTALKESQRAWLKFVELQMKVMFFVKEGENPREVYGSMYAMEFAEEKTKLITARIAQLRNLLEE